MNLKTDWQMNDIVTPEAFNDIGVVVNGIGEELGKKVSMPIEIPTGGDLNAYIKTGFYYSVLTTDIKNGPFDPLYSFSLLVEATGRWYTGVSQTLHYPALNTVFYRFYEPNPSVEVSKYWTPWIRLATSEPPQLHELPLSSGFSIYQRPYYCKDQFGKVTLWGSVKKSSALNFSDHVATLPVGFRPQRAFEAPVTTISPNGASLVFINTDGKITIGQTPTGDTMFFNISFLVQ